VDESEQPSKSKSSYLQTLAVAQEPFGKLMAGLRPERNTSTKCYTALDGDQRFPDARDI